jgi:hypothetical protein
MKYQHFRSVAFGFALAFGLILTGCAHIGPETVTVDRFDYSSAIADSWKQQILLNIVKVRYLDLPVFVDVASIVSGYSLQTGVSVGGTVSSDKAIQGNFFSSGAQGIYTDRPTITYVPMTGEKFLRGLLTPIDPKAIFSLLQSGYAADFILALTVESLNGVRNRSATAGVARDADPDFIRVLELMRDVQAAGGFAMRVEDDKVKGTTGVVFFRRDTMPPEVLEKAVEIRRLLRMPVDQEKFTIVYSPVLGSENELAVNSRSMLQIMGAFASYIEVPPEHLKDQRALPGVDSSAQKSDRQQVSIHSSKEKPTEAYAAVHYRDYWFWIDDNDWRSKRAMTAIIFFFTLFDTGGNQGAPLITIPAQ